MVHAGQDSKDHFRGGGMRMEHDDAHMMAADHKTDWGQVTAGQMRAGRVSFFFSGTEKKR